MKVVCPKCGKLPIDLNKLGLPDMPELIKEVQKQFEQKGGANCKACGSPVKVEAGT